MRRLLDLLDTFLHKVLDPYIRAGGLGWGTLQTWQWRVCQALENSLATFDEEDQ